MSGGGWAMLVAIVLAAGAIAFLLFAMIRSIVDERRRGGEIWRDFGLSIALVILFFTSWAGHAIGEWQVYTDEQIAHGERTSVGDFVAQFTQATLENWQSEFLQLFAFVVLAALLIHKGSAESKDGEERTHRALQRIEEKLGTLPATKDEQPAA